MKELDDLKQKITEETETSNVDELHWAIKNVVSKFLAKWRIYWAFEVILFNPNYNFFYFMASGFVIFSF